ncbi:MAG: hypothetical protein QOF16_532 [Actinomycetota bacterium]|jgi:hypothetical protein|nr:hypothetical protein [Actinomycetota bacterium]MEA2486878.1 hypothetical protein [Actinomycetota bacterium]
MGRKAAATLAGLVAAATLIPAGTAFGGTPETVQTVCAPVPVTIDTKDVHVGGQTVHVGSRSGIQVCATTDTRVNVTPTITFFKNCGDACFAVRVARVDVYEDIQVDLTWREDGVAQSIALTPDPVDLTQDVDDICVSNHSEGTSDPCDVALVSPSDLTATGRHGRIHLGWSPATEAYGRTAGLHYEIWMSETGEANTFSLLATSPTTTFVDRGLARGTQRYYYVVAVDPDGNRSGGSNQAVAIAK